MTSYFFFEIRKWTLDRSGVILEGQFLVNIVWLRMSIKTLLLKFAKTLLFYFNEQSPKENEK